MNKYMEIYVYIYKINAKPIKLLEQIWFLYMFVHWYKYIIISFPNQQASRAYIRSEVPREVL